ncbi:hypothetical protein [Grimontia sp. SpTr1]|uniref:hypothetical protein n=1 Tax=Grimontia sp. SpTr1 TaxID=2995319 RepID=UPI00248CD72E|nr:hypothetical protein [Grimontia sp. SpTr1]
MKTLGQLIRTENQILRVIAKKYEESLSDEFYIARRNLLLACSALIFLTVAVLEKCLNDVELALIIKAKVSSETVFLLLAIACTYFYFRFRALGNVSLINAHERSYVDYVSLICLDKFNAQLDRQLEALSCGSNQNYPQFRFNDCCSNLSASSTATPNSYFEVHLRLDSKHMKGFKKEEIEKALEVLGESPSYHTFDNGEFALTIDKSVHLNFFELSQYQRIERYMLCAKQSLFIETVLPSILFWFATTFATVASIFLNISN